MNALEGVLEAGMPLFLVGDFNSPSHLDWTAAVAEERDDVRYPVAWPVGVLTEEAGFRDSYREAHEDPVTKPGLTWTPGGPESVKNEVHDRIDWVLVAGPADTVASEIVGESDYADTDIASDPYPSDHRVDYLLYEYTRTGIEGEVTFSKASLVGSGSWPLAPGRYEARLMVDDGYETIARSAPFSVNG